MDGDVGSISAQQAYYFATNSLSDIRSVPNERLLRPEKNARPLICRVDHSSLLALGRDAELVAERVEGDLRPIRESLFGIRILAHPGQAT